MIDTFSKKMALAIMTACGGVLWLKIWHQYIYTRNPASFPPASTWLRDSMVVFIPVVLAVWTGSGISQSLLAHPRLDSPSTRSVMSVFILGGLASVAIVLIEGSRFFLTGIGNEFVFLSNICGKIFSRSNILLNVLQSFFPDYRAVQLHILMQDGFYLILFNLVVTILFILVMEGMLSVKSARNREVVLGNPVDGLCACLK